MVSTESLEKLQQVNTYIDNSNLRIIDDMVRNFFRKNTNFIESAFAVKEPLHYAVVLRQDSIHFRNALLRFYEVYDLSTYAKRYPVYFQFIPPAVAHKIKFLEKIDIS